MDFRFLEDLASKSLEAGATDVLLRSGEVPRIRQEQKVLLLDEIPVPEKVMVDFWNACGVDPTSITEHDIRYKRPEGGYLRVNLYRSMGELAAAIRPIKEVIPPLNELGVPDEMVRRWMDRQSGIFLVSGPTGSGKSTTLAACLDDVNHRENHHIVTIEDPIEYIFKNDQCFFSQREVESDTDGFGTALRATLRQNPDVIFIGEIRDEETAKIALRASETGHLVLATLHSSGVVETLERLANLFLPERRPEMLRILSIQLIGILSQRLLPGLQGGLELVSEHFQNEGATRTWVAEGALTQIADFIRRRENPNSRDLLTSLIEASKQGRISEEVARRAAPHAGDFERTMRGIS